MSHRKHERKLVDNAHFPERRAQLELAALNCTSVVRDLPAPAQCGYGGRE